MRHMTLAKLCTALLFLAVSSARAEDHPPHWDYGHHHGPAAWSSMEPEFAECKLGKEQSPIDIRDAVKSAGPKKRRSGVRHIAAFLFLSMFLSEKCAHFSGTCSSSAAALAALGTGRRGVVALGERRDRAEPGLDRFDARPCTTRIGFE